MKVFGVWFLVAITLTGVAAPFHNLGFDEANTNGVSPNTFAAPSQLLPSWRLFNELGEPSLIGYDANTIGLNQVVLYDKNFLNFGAPVPGEGYALGLWPGPGLEVRRAILLTTYLK